MKRKNTVLFLVLCLVMSSIAFAGGQKAQPQAGSTVPRRTDGWFAGKDFSKHFEVEYAEAYVDESKNYASGDDWVRNWANNFNVTYSIIPMTQENWAERVRVWVNAGDAPEWFTVDFNREEGRTWAEQGLVKKLPDDWKTKYPNLAQAHAKSGLAEYTDREFGGTYFFHRPIFALNSPPVSKSVGHWTFYMRKDWGQAAGYPTKDAMKLSEIIEYARRVKAADPGKVGSGFSPIVFLASEITNFVGVNTGGLGYRLGKDGRYYWTPGDPKTLEVLKMIAAAYQEGLVDREFYTIQLPDNLGAFYTTGRAAVVQAAGMGWRMTEFDNHFKTDLGLNYEDVVAPVVLTAEDGLFYGRNAGIQTWGSIAFSPDIDEAKLDRILQMLDYSCTNEGQYEIRLGLKDIDWKLDAGGEPVSLIPPGTVTEKYALTPVYSWMFILPDDFQFVDPATTKNIRDKIREMYILREKLTTEESFPSAIDWNLELFTPKVRVPSINYGEEFSALIVRGGNLEANWRAWVREKQAIIQPELDELNALYGKK
jgi:putative aldouronate transport system substrate-binding protein